MKPTIHVSQLNKTFKTTLKEAGVLAGFKSFFSPKYKTTKAVDNISFSINKGEAVAFIGPNGAGKSTTLKMLTGILYPTSGTIKVLGLNPQQQRKQLAYKLGTVFGQKTQLWLHLPAQESFDLFAKIYDLDEKKYRKKINELIKTFEVEELLQTPVRKLSLGQRMRCELVLALLHEPEVLLLDEPTIGLDIVSKKALRNTIKKLHEKGLTILLTSHDLDDIEFVCDRVIIINHGKIIYDDSLAQLKKEYLKKKIVEVVFDTPTKKSYKKKGATILMQEEFMIRYEIDLEVIKTRAFIKELLEQHNNIADLTINDMSIEEIIEEIYHE